RSGSGDDEATVRRILGQLGTPDEVVKAAAGRPLPRHAGEARNAAEAAQAAGEPGPAIPLPRDEAGPSARPGREPEWWRVPAQRSSAARTNELLAGWSGGLLPPEPDDEDE